MDRTPVTCFTVASALYLASTQTEYFYSYARAQDLWPSNLCLFEFPALAQPQLLMEVWKSIRPATKRYYMISRVNQTPFSFIMFGWANKKKKGSGSRDSVLH